MLSALNKPGIRSLAFNVAIFCGGTLAMNGLIFGLGWSNSSGGAPEPRWAPPGWVVGAVWSVLLFPLMATARWLTNSRTDKVATKARASVTLLLISCLIWPLYSLAINSLIGGLIGNVWTIFLALFVTARLRRVSTSAALCVFPVALWVAFATTIVLHELRWLG